ncbi:MAG: CapA family protein, partial [Myxococcota bacterium]
MRKFFLTVLLSSVLAACGASPKQAPAPAPEAPVVEAPAADVPVAELPETPAVPEEAPISEEARAQAKALIEQGKAVQREKGEGGAQEAIDLYNQALKLDPKNPAAYWELGWSHQVLDQLGEAVEAWDTVRELDPEYPELDTYYPVLKMRHEQAEKLSKLPDPGVIPEPELEPYDGPTLTFAAVGDVQTGRGWPEHRAVLPPNDGAGYFDGVKDWLRDADVTFGNLEQALADGGESTKCGPRSTKCFAFRVPTSHADMYQDAGFDMMSIANNHAGDFGQEGRDSTMKALDERGIVYSGPVGVIATKEVKGLRVGMIAFSTGGGVYRVQQLDVARKVVAEVARTHDIVVASFHGGAEGSSATHVPKEVETFYGENRGN